MRRLRDLCRTGMRAIGLMAMLLGCSAVFAADIMFFQHDEYAGARFEVDSDVPDFAQHGFGGVASSVVVTRGRWEVCTEAWYRGRCTMLTPGSYPSLSMMGMNDRVASARRVQGERAGREPPWAGGREGSAIVMYEHDNFRGRSMSAYRAEPDLQNSGMNDRVSSVVIERGEWELCADAGFSGRCIVLGPGNYPSLRAYGFNDTLSSTRPLAGGGGWSRGGPPQRADIMLFEHDDFHGRSIGGHEDMGNLAPTGFNDMISSVIVERGTWELCVDAEYRGRCIVLAPGRYPALAAYDMNDAVSSVRRVEPGNRGRSRIYEAR
ncbi:MAG TPA: beta/gamma crystallin-related protein [Burkholderiaceae bacterium]|nr:beta/gamma crystallin-related protein [Burkholderiaceae bacterium]